MHYHHSGKHYADRCGAGVWLEVHIQISRQHEERHGAWLEHLKPQSPRLWLTSSNKAMPSNSGTPWWPSIRICEPVEPFLFKPPQRFKVHSQGSLKFSNGHRATPWVLGSSWVLFLVGFTDTLFPRILWESPDSCICGASLRWMLMESSRTRINRLC